MTLNQKFGYLFGAVYALVGVVGFAIIGGLPFAGTEGEPLVLFDVNPLHNLVHIAVGGLFLVGAAAGAAWSWKVNRLIGAVYLAVGALGLFLVGGDLNILALNHPDNGLHLVTGIAALVVSARGAKEAASSLGTSRA
jgi:hypothetical protein